MTGFSGFAGSGAAGFSATGGLASSSAMMRRIEARISSIEGSWTFAGCVISDSTSSTPSHALFLHALFYTKHDKIRRFRMCRPELSMREPDLSPVHAPHDCAHRRHVSCPSGQDATQLAGDWCESLCRAEKAMSWQRANASKGWMLADAPRNDARSGYFPSGVRTPNQLSRTCW
jgi:hypothetical protein